MAGSRRPPSPELTNLDCAFPPFPTTGSKANKSEKTTARSKTIRSRPQSPSSSTSASRAGSIKSTRQRSKSVAGDDRTSRPGTAAGERRPSLSSGNASRKPSADEVPPLPTSLPHAAPPTLERAETTPGFNSDHGPKPGLHRFATADDVTNFPMAPKEGPPRREPSYKSKRPPPIVSDIPVDADGRPSLAKMRSPTAPPPSSGSSLGRSLTKLFGRRRSQSLSAKREIVRTALSDEPDEMPTPPIPLSSYDWPRNGPLTPNPFFLPNSAPITDTTSPRQPPLIVEHRVSSELPQKESASEAREKDRVSEEMVKTESEPSQSDTKHLDPAEALTFNFDWNEPSQQSQVPPTPSSIAQRPTDLHRASIDSASSYGSIDFTEHTASSRSSPPPIDDFHGTSGDSGRISSATSVLAEMPPPLRPRNGTVSLESPTDPLFVDGRLSPIPPADKIKEEAAMPLEAVETEAKTETKSAVVPFAPRKDSLASQGRAVGPHKGICRGCSKPILPQQKSVSSADGRLTGRYHKDCFLCWTCKTPFPTSEIYVHADHPYCAHHYHELSNSLCATCGKGIEGLYMETANVAGRGREKHHPHCLKCATCRIQLNTDYFELSGKVYCERDAFRLASLPRVHNRSPAKPSPLVREYISSGNPELLKGKNFPERRITRLMTTT